MANNRVIGVKKSQFSAGTTVSGSATFDYVENGTNIKITFTDLLSNLGVTGTLEQVGDPLGSPVLDIQGDINGIRNIESGSGIAASISPQNGVEIAHNFTIDQTGVPIVSGESDASPVVRSISGQGGIAVSAIDDEIIVDGGVIGISSRVIVNSAADLSGTLDGEKEYFIDGVIDMGATSIEVPSSGLNLSGLNFDVSKLISSEPGYTMFTSPVGGSGNVLGKDYSIEVTGAGSQAYDLTSATGFDAFEFARINYNDCTSLGTITDYRQGLEVGTGRFGGTPELTLAGNWLGGFFIDTSIVRSLTDGAYTLFKAGAGLMMESRFRSNQNIDLPASVSFFDFSPSNFNNPSTVQIEGAIVTRNGVFDATDANITPNMSQSDLVSAWTSNNGMPNTFEGGSIGVTTETATLNSGVGIGVFLDVAATAWTSADLQHFDSPAAGQLRHLGNTPREFKVIANFALDSANGNDLVLRVTKWDDSASSFITVLDQTREVNSFVGGRDVAFFNININTTLDQNDYIKLEVANNTAANNVTAETDSYFIVEAR